MVGESEARSATKAAKTLRRTPATTASISQAMAEMVSLRFHCLGRQWRSKSSSKKAWGQAHSRTPRVRTVKGLISRAVSIRDGGGGWEVIAPSPCYRPSGPKHKSLQQL